MVDNSTQTTIKLQMPRDHRVEESFNDSFISLGSEADPRDPELAPDGYEEDSDIESEGSEKDNVAKERKMIVFESCLEELLQKWSDFKLKQVTDKRFMGYCAIYTLKRANCDFEKTWTSQPISGRMPYGNLILSGTIMFAEASPVKCLRVLNFAAIQTFSLSTYMSI